MDRLTGADEDVPRGRPFVDVELREHFPAASSSQDTYTLLKFYNLSKDLIKTVLRVRLDMESCSITVYLNCTIRPPLPAASVYPDDQGLCCRECSS